MEGPLFHLCAWEVGMTVTLKEVRANHKIRKLIDGANEVMKAMGYTEHGHRHVTVVSSITRYILDHKNLSPREVELAQIAAYMHDIGNSISRIDRKTVLLADCRNCMVRQPCCDGILRAH